MEEIIVTSEQAGQRLDKFLAKEFFLYSRVNIIKRIKKGEVLVNNKKIKPSYILEEGNAVMLENFSREAEKNELFINKKILLDVIFQNKDIVVINKQAGLQVHPSIGEKRDTLVNALLAYFPEIMSIHDDSIGAELRPGIVHRLDKDTTGLIVIARNKKSFNALKGSFKERSIQKYYLAIVEGIVKEEVGIIDKPLAKSSDYSKQVVARSNTKTTIRNAKSHYRVLDHIGGYSLIEVEPKTGRTHQIRVHLASIGHPIVGDLIYNEKKSKKGEKNEEIRKNRQLLHAHKLKFDLFGKKYQFEAPAPKDFDDFLAQIRQ